MGNIIKFLTAVLETLARLPVLVLRFLTEWVAFNPRLGPLRHVFLAAFAYVTFAVCLVYVVAPIRAITGAYTIADKLKYDAERWIATAIYDRRGSFVGTFDPRLDSVRDVNYTDRSIELGDYTANPDHKSIPVRDVPEFYWKCLVYHEDRYLGSWLNPYGIDLLGVLKIPLSSIQRTIAAKRPSIGVGGSTLPMQFVRVIYKTPPDASEGGFNKLRRKFGEWWLAPVVHRVLTQDGDTPLKQWAANHIWLAQRTGGSPLHGVEVTSRIVFGKEASELTIAEQMVLASAVNKPIILMPGSDKLNEVRLDRWRYITEVRARTCAEKLITDEKTKADIVFELVGLAGGPPDPKVRPRLQEALDKFAPTLAARAQANPVIRANALMPSARFGVREEMKQTYGFSWRSYVRGVTTTLDTVENLEFNSKLTAALARIDQNERVKISVGYALDPARANEETKIPNVVVVAADHKGEIVRYYETGETAAYFGASVARSPETGRYEPEHDPRMIASTGKIIAAIAIANTMRDTQNSLYLDTEAPASGLDTCARGGSERHGRRAIVSFACSLNPPLINRTALVGQSRVQMLIDRLGFTMPPADAAGGGVPPSTAVVLGQISGSPRRVHMMSSVVLASLLRRGSIPVKLPTLVKSYDYTSTTAAAAAAGPLGSGVVPSDVIRPEAVPLVRALLEAPLCYTTGKKPAGTLRSLSHWCAARRNDLRFHFAKTGTQVTEDPNATVDVWTTGGLQFSNGAAYSYVVLVGTGAVREPWATSLHAAQVAAPLLEVLLDDLKSHARTNPQNQLLPPPPPAPAVPVASSARSAPKVTAADEISRNLGRP
ncbi:MAG: glycosyl transferase family 51 [Hyphomicrobium sp.]|nr:glycosyl transferase family 51 [Hyphomicrobium sp.]PPD07794.1 MAG: glycosyl transferase family 51 [Hyphomicrobium sp.]